MRNTTPLSDQRNDVLGDGNNLARLCYQRIKALPLEPVPNDALFCATAAQDKFILRPAPARAKSPPRVQPSAGLPSYLIHLYEIPLLTREQEFHLFRKMNYLKFKASKLVALLDPERPKPRLLNQIEQFFQQAVEVRNEIIRANLRLVVAMTKRYARSNQPLFELVSDGNISLMRAVEKFDYARGTRFSTYATCTIIRNFAQATACEFRDRARFRNTGDEVFQSVTDWRINPQTEEAALLRGGARCSMRNHRSVPLNSGRELERASMIVLGPRLIKSIILVTAIGDPAQNLSDSRRHWAKTRPGRNSEQACRYERTGESHRSSVPWCFAGPM